MYYLNHEDPPAVMVVVTVSAADVFEYCLNGNAWLALYAAVAASLSCPTELKALSQNFGVGGTGAVGGLISNRFLSYAGVGNGFSRALEGAELSAARARFGVVRSLIASRPLVNFDLKPPVLGVAVLSGVPGDLRDLALRRLL